MPTSQAWVCHTHRAARLTSPLPPHNTMHQNSTALLLNTRGEHKHKLLPSLLERSSDCWLSYPHKHNSPKLSSENKHYALTWQNPYPSMRTASFACLKDSGLYLGSLSSFSSNSILQLRFPSALLLSHHANARNGFADGHKNLSLLSLTSLFLWEKREDPTSHF